jgi:hypothetical protein
LRGGDTNVETDVGIGVVGRGVQRGGVALLPELELLGGIGGIRLDLVTLKP